MGNATKTKILEEALASFARDGYKGTNLRDLAARLELSKSALYRYFDGKEAIWNAVIDMMEEYYEAHFGSTEHLPAAPRSGEELLSMTMRMLDFTLHDEKVILTRRLLLTEQFHNEQAKKLATLHFLTGIKDIYTGIFAEMAANNILDCDDPAMLAFAYTTPITALVHLCDREPEKEAEIRNEIEAFVRHFIRTYAKGEQIA